MGFCAVFIGLNKNFITLLNLFRAENIGFIHFLNNLKGFALQRSVKSLSLETDGYKFVFTADIFGFCVRNTNNLAPDGCVVKRSAVAPEMLGTYFVSYYVKGLWYYIIHFASVVISILALYIPLVKISEKIVKGIHHTPDLACVENSEDGEESKIDEIGNEFDEMAGENFVTTDEELSVEVDTISCQQDNCNLNDVEN